jgi:hypothetical protein
MMDAGMDLCDITILLSPMAAVDLLLSIIYIILADLRFVQEAMGFSGKWE